MDDCLLDDRQWTVMVAVMDLCLDWILHLFGLRLFDWPHWCNISHRVPRRYSGFIWNLGISVASIQSRGYGSMCYVLVVLRVVQVAYILQCIWFGVQSWIGGKKLRSFGFPYSTLMSPATRMLINSQVNA